MVQQFSVGPYYFMGGNFCTIFGLYYFVIVSGFYEKVYWFQAISPYEKHIIWLKQSQISIVLFPYVYTGKVKVKKV